MNYNEMSWELIRSGIIVQGSNDGIGCVVAVSDNITYTVGQFLLYDPTLATEMDTGLRFVPAAAVFAVAPEESSA